MSKFDYTFCMKNPRSIRALFCFPGFTATSTSKGVFGDRYSRIINLQWKKTATCSRGGHRCTSGYNRKTRQVRDLSAAGWRIYLEFERWRVKCPKCLSVHVEHLDWLAKNPRYTQRFAMHVGNLCRDMTVSRVAEIERLHRSTV